MGRRLQHFLTIRSDKDNNDLTSDMIWLTTAEDCSKLDSVESDFIRSRHKQPAPTTPITTTTTIQATTDEQTTYTTEAHDHNEVGGGPKRKRQKRRRRCAAHPLSINRQENLHYQDLHTSFLGKLHGQKKRGFGVALVFLDLPKIRTFVLVSCSVPSWLFFRSCCMLLPSR